jgi:hypothetical protein
MRSEGNDSTDTLSDNRDAGEMRTHVNLILPVTPQHQTQNFSTRELPSSHSNLTLYDSDGLEFSGNLAEQRTGVEPLQLCEAGIFRNNSW